MKKENHMNLLPCGIPQLQFEFKRSSIQLLLTLLLEIMPKAIRSELEGSG
jgi:hypothetical protein